MPSKDTIPFKITKKTHEEILRIRDIVSKEMGIDIEKITLKQAEIILRIKSNKGKITIKEINDILIGKIT